jgi:acetylornithine deacetylase/succinyl-diaminopimelate desuccinylase-like protein
LGEADLGAEATALLRDLVRVDSSNPPGGETPAALVLRQYLESHGVSCELVARKPDRANLIARLPGSGGGPSLMLLGHTDVVPADARDWTHPPFSGHLDASGYVWGRGAVDMKNEVATRAVALAALARDGFRPRGDLVLVAAADEEDGSEKVGMTWLVGERPDLATDYVVNEGAAERLVLADGRVVATINLGEKATLPARVTALGEAGPTTLPHAGTGAVVRLARLLERLDSYRPRRRLLPETRPLLEALVGSFDDLDDAIGRAVALHPAFADLVAPLFATTIAPTRLAGSDALNVMPARASVDCDCRLLPGDTEADLRAELEEALGDDLPYELEFLEPPTGGTLSPLDTPLFAACREVLAELDPDAILLPTICNGFTDSHYVRTAFGATAYGFWPVRHTPYEVAAAGVHAADERIHSADLGYATRFHVELCRTLLG